MSVDLNKDFCEDLETFAALFEAVGQAAKADLKRAHLKIGERTKAEAQKRVPVDTSNLKQRILTNTYDRQGDIYTETGTNVQEYPVALEFGTDRIAKGRVKALGTKPGITDAQAIKDWPAKSARMQLQEGKKDSGELAAALKRRAARGGPEQQMPWLRPAFTAIKQWAMDTLAAALKPPKNRGRASG